MRRTWRVSILLMCVLLCCSCEQRDRTQPVRTIRLATTTSTVNSGLLDELLPVFRRQTGIEVQVLPMGTGKALRTGRDGNCDVLLVHAPDAEQLFVAQGWGVQRRAVMYNDFVLLGPAGDPAGMRTLPPTEAMQRIAIAKCIFVSRGDQSGTHQKELALWKAVGLEPSGEWYRAVGKGMGETLTIADEMQAYVLADRGTFLKFRRKIDLKVLVEGSPLLHNPYSAIAVNPKKHPHVRYEDAMKFIEFLTSDTARTIIANYRLEGEALFHPSIEATISCLASESDTDD